MSNAVIKLEKVSKTYGSGAAEAKAVSEVSMTVERGSWVAIMGPSGHGKSTLLQLIGGLDRPSAGRIVLDGSELGTLDAAELAAVRGKKIGFVFQFFNLMPHLTALENVEIALWLGGGAHSKGRAMGLLERFGLGDKAHHLPSMLSGGQQQRVAIARALANEPDILLMDEPTGNLDSGSEAELLTLLGELHKAGKTLIMVTHNPTVASHAQRLVHVKDGRIEEDRCNGV
ncbi:MAG: ABC transporter ATP-binding protein [Acidithiobacillus ferriphilus]|nr:MAG: ABC transporter ATP-binding protein [Thiobacillus sp. 65-29]OYX28937.1 MAG: ABC transporter ATP-binding protein [Hydrogenophilales bacterium 32-62-9]OYY59203.1 MAG: ABC transporter ATP-binding protein [Hydrogenophilales bacterium 28-61-11]